MEDILLKELQARRTRIRSRWIDLLHTERPPSPLGDPVILSHLFDLTLDEILVALATPTETASSAPSRPECVCACNPLRHYFSSLEQALLEALVFAQAHRRACMPDPAARTAAVQEVRTVLRAVASRELALYDSLCVQSPAVAP